METPGVVFVDIETTGLDPERHEMWEVALIESDGNEHVWQLAVDLTTADPMALKINRFHERRDQDTYAYADAFCETFEALTRGQYLAGCNPGFDERFLRRFLLAHAECPMWQYRTIAVEALAAGYARGQMHAIAMHGDIAKFGGLVEAGQKALPPWNSTELAEGVGVRRSDDTKHTAIGDARWARDVYLRVMGPARGAAGEELFVPDDVDLCGNPHPTIQHLYCQREPSHTGRHADAVGARSWGSPAHNLGTPI